MIIYEKRVGDRAAVEIADSYRWAKRIQLPAADSRVLRKETPRTPPGPEGSNGTGQFPVPQVRLAIIRRASAKIEKSEEG